MKQKFIKPEHDKDINAVDYFNQFRTWDEVFKNIKNIHFIDDLHIANSVDLKKTAFIISGYYLDVVEKNDLQLPSRKYTKFMLYSKLQHKSNNHAAISFIERNFLHKEIPYIRVGTDYFKIINKIDRYGIDRKILKGWKKEEIKQDHDKDLLKYITKFDDFCIEPDNMNYQMVVGNCYNLYSEFSHKPGDGDIKTSMNLIEHIFGNQYELGLKYLKILFENPRQCLPVLCLVSSERQTGKTTFINWMNMIFGDNFAMINPEDLSSQFNSAYAYKNIIAIDETVIDRISSVEKLKSIATAKTISVNQKFVSNYSLPFFGKVIISTNKEKDFMRIDEEEIRFWVRKVKHIPKINTNIEIELAEEIPAFLKYLQSLPAVDTTKSRMVFTQADIFNPELSKVKTESWSGLRKELHILFEDYFNKNQTQKSVKATAKDIKNYFFQNNHQISAHYIGKVLKDEIKVSTQKIQRYQSFDSQFEQVGTPFEFLLEDYTQVIENNNVMNDVSEQIPSWMRSPVKD